MLVLMDLGSALLSAETALNCCPRAERPGGSARPLVEGTLAAVVALAQA